MKKNFRITQDDFLLANRRAAREEEIHAHGKQVIFRPVWQKSKKRYDRNKEKLAEIYPKDAWSELKGSVVRPTLVADFRPTPLSIMATEPKAEWPWSLKQSFTAGVQPDGNVCRAELNEA